MLWGEIFNIFSEHDENQNEKKNGIHVELPNQNQPGIFASCYCPQKNIFLKKNISKTAKCCSASMVPTSLEKENSVPYKHAEPLN